MFFCAFSLQANQQEKAQALYEKGEEARREARRSESPNYDLAIGYLEAAGELGSVDAMTELIMLYGSLAARNFGKTNSKRFMEKGAYWALKAARIGDVFAQGMIAFKYLEGAGVDQDYEKAEFWYRKAAKNGDERAQDLLETYTRGGLSFEEGVEIELDRSRGAISSVSEEVLFNEMKKMAEQGDAGACFIVGTYYEDGIEGVFERDFKVSLSWYQKAIEIGSSSKALLRKGMIHMNQEFEGRVYSIAIDCLLEAADQGEVEAYHWIGFMYFEGYGFPKNEKRAVGFFEKGALAGVVKSQGMLSLMLAAGIGVLQNEVDGYAWAIIAAEGGFLAARDTLEPFERPIKILAQERAIYFKEMVSRSTLDDSPQGQPSGSGFGSGLLFNGRYILTAHHVIEGANGIEALIDGDLYRATVFIIDKESDLAVLDLENELPGSIDLVIKDAEFGEEVFTIGYPNVQIQGSEAKYTAGVVSSLSGIGDDSRFLQITVPVQPGNSGGPLFSHDGALVGVVVSQLDAQKVMAASGSIPQNVNYATNSSIVRRLLLKNGIVSRGFTGARKDSIDINTLKSATALILIDR
jgi:TPR repeat protein